MPLVDDVSKGAKPNDKRVIVATITTVFGIKGWVKIASHTQPPENVFKYKPWQVQISRPGAGATVSGSGAKASQQIKSQQTMQWQTLNVTAFKQHSKGLLAQLNGCNDRDEARRYVGLDVYVSQELMAPLETGEYYWHDLEGLNVINQKGCLFGKVDHLLETGANDVLVIQACKGSIDDKERLIPYLLDQVIKNIDTSRGEIRVEWDEDF